MLKRLYKHFHMCCGLGSGAAGFNDSKPIVGGVQAHWQCLGGIDVDPAGVRDFLRLTGVAATLMDLFTRQQYTAFHGVEPPLGWAEATPEDIRGAAGNQDPDAVFISSPCKGASGLLPESLSQTPKYQALNELTLRCVWLMLEAWKHKPVKLIIFENVPRLATRGRHLLDQINQLFAHYGYAVAETTHDCGKIGGLAQSRKRFLLVARHVAQVPAFLYEPEKRSLRAVGDVLSRMPLAGDIEQAGPMHRVPALQWKTWVRLALVEAGKDWRSLNRFAIEDGHLRDFVIMPEYRSGFLGVHNWADNTGTIAGRSSPTNGALSVADPRPAGKYDFAQYGVLPWNRHSGVVTGQRSPGQGTFSVADPRQQGLATHNSEFRIIPLEHRDHSTGQSVADPRPNWKRHSNNLAVMDWARHSGTVIAGGKGVQGGQLSIADPRPGMARKAGDAYLTGGHYGVVSWGTPAGAVSACARQDNGRWSVADPRLPTANDRLTCIIRSLDDTWHRPFTTLELAALQSMFDPEDIWSADTVNRAEIRRMQGAELFVLDGKNDGAHRERIGNAVPRKAGKAIADVMGTTLLLVDAGETFMLSNVDIWVRPLAMALSVSQEAA